METKSWRMGVYPVQRPKRRMRVHEALAELRLFNHNEAADTLEEAIGSLQDALAREQGYL